LDRVVDARPCVIEFIDLCDKLQIFADRQVFPEAEALGHVAHFALDLFALGADVVAETRSRAIVGTQQAAQHADGCGLARTVGAKKSPDLAFRHLNVDMIDGDLAAELLGQPMHVDGECAHSGCTSTGWPGLSLRPPGARASSLKTSFSRLPTLKITGGVNSCCWAMKVTVAVMFFAQESQVMETFCPSFILANCVSGTKKRI